MGHIYMLKNKINGKVYIGQTIRPIHKRLEEHRTGRSKRCRAIYNAIQKYGWENFEKDWYGCPDEDLNFEEDLLVSEMETLAPEGYNLKEGGGSNGKLSEETKQRISEAKQNMSEETRRKMSEATRGDKNHNYGKTKSEETKQKMSKAHTGKTLNKEYRKKISEATRGDKNHNYGKPKSEETKQKMSKAQLGEKNHNYGKTMSEETRQKMSKARLGEKHHKSKRVYQYDLNGTFIDSYASCGEAGRHFKKSGVNISACARGVTGYKTAYNFKWSYIFDIFI
jgi:group I intron endonuclease